MDNYEQLENQRKRWRIVKVTLVVWFALGLLLSYIAYGVGLDSRQCTLCNWLADTFSSIDIAATKSDYPNVMRVIWLYFIVTTPLIFINIVSSLRYYSPKNEKSVSPGLFGVFLCIVFFGILVLLSLIFFWDAGVDVTFSPSGYQSKWGGLFAHTILGAFVMCYSAFFTISTSLFFIISILITHFKR